MSVLDKVIATITPPESAEARIEAREKAVGAASPGDWLSQILDHHCRIEALLAAVKSATTADARIAAQKKLAVVLTGHAVAEEAAIYPALAADKQVGHAELACQEQSAAKMEMGLLERLDPMSRDYLDCTRTSAAMRLLRVFARGIGPASRPWSDACVSSSTGSRSSSTRQLWPSYCSWPSMSMRPTPVHSRRTSV